MAAGTIGAQAADLGAAPVFRKAPAVPGYSWTGSYIGGYVGGASASRNAITNDPAMAPHGFDTRGNYNGEMPVSYGLGSSVIGGVTGGYNYQFAPNWVIGYEGETGYMRLRGSAVMNPLTWNDTVASTTIGDWYSAYTGRLGYAWDRSLFYAKGGVVLARVETGVVDTYLNLLGSTLDTTSRKWRLGYAVGGGWEYAFDSKWSLKAEYLYFGLERDIVTSGVVIPLNVTDYSTTRVPGIHTGKIGLNYKWDWTSLLR